MKVGNQCSIDAGSPAPTQKAHAIEMQVSLVPLHVRCITCFLFLQQWQCCTWSLFYFAGFLNHRLAMANSLQEAAAAAAGLLSKDTTRVSGFRWLPVSTPGTAASDALYVLFWLDLLQHRNICIEDSMNPSQKFGAQQKQQLARPSCSVSPAHHTNQPLRRPTQR